LPFDSEFDFRLDGYAPASDELDGTWQRNIAVEQDMLASLTEHHTSDGRNSYYVLYNRAATWGHPGDPQIVALHLQRDADAKTFTFQHADLPLPAMAQSWLIARGCPRETIASLPGAGARPADAATRALEERLRGDGDHFALLHSYTRDAGAESEVTVLLRALEDRAPDPFRVLLEQHDLDAGTYSLREGVFDTLDAAVHWLRTRDTPLPAPSSAARPRPASPRPSGHTHTPPSNESPRRR
jgi:hypothetical protein